jgi:crossover junction endodeoxyribonuclease RuvC
MPENADSPAARGRPYRVVGVDPGIANLGLGAIEEVRPGARLLATEVVRTRSGDPQSERLLILRDAVAAFLDAHHPDALSIEGQFFHQQRDVSFRVGQAYGVVLLAAAERHVPVHEYGPMQVKQALVGTGRAQKAQVGFMVRALLGLDKAVTNHHAADALALALTHLHSRRLSSLIDP